MTLDVDRVRRVADDVAKQMRIGVPALAEGIIRVANANMERAIRVVSVERGHDPRDFALVAFGGAGGMHACEIATRLDIRTVIVPRHAGVLSALGMLVADVVRDYSASVLAASHQVSFAELERHLAPLVARARRARGGRIPQAARVIDAHLDVRYVGQSYEITVPFGRDYRQVFDKRHGQRYGYMDRSGRRKSNVRVTAAGLTAKPKLPFGSPGARSSSSSHTPPGTIRRTRGIDGVLSLGRARARRPRDRTGRRHGRRSVHRRAAEVHVQR